MEREQTMDEARPQPEAQEGKRGLSRRQLLAGSAGVAGVLAGAGLLSRGEEALAAPSRGSAMHFTRNMAGVSMFLKIDTILGESIDKQHPGEIDVLAFSLGGSNPHSASAGTGSGTGKVNVQDLSVTKYLDRASIDLTRALASGRRLSQAILTVRRTSPTPMDFLKITLRDILVTSMSMSGSGGEDRLTENVSLNFAHIMIQYWMQNSNGSQGPGTSGGWDIGIGPGK